MSDDPVQVSVAPDEGQNRLWGIPVLGIVVRSILVIPQAVLLFILGIGLYLFFLVNWIPILINGRMAGWGYALVGGYLRVSVRSSLYTLLVTGRYPPFALTGDHSMAVTIDAGEVQNRLWGIPFLGVAVRSILLIPHFLVIWVLSIAVALLSLVIWVPVLLNGRQAPAIVNLYAGFYRWLVRIVAYLFLLTGRYPPFSLRD